MNVIELRAPDGTIYAFACGHCRHVSAGSSYMRRYDDKDVAAMAENSRTAAERCCRCHGCQGPVFHSDGHGIMRYCTACWEGGERQKDEERRAKFEAEAARERDVREASLSKALDREAALSLEHLMSDLSEARWCAGWLVNLEFILWNEVVAGPGCDPAFWQVDTDRLKTLSDRAGGWWRYQRFVPIDEWKQLFERHGGKGPRHPWSSDDEDGA